MSSGDYISKSALIKNLKDWKFQECPVGVCDEETETYKTICECIEAVEEQPTLDEKEIIRKTVERIVNIVEDYMEDAEHYGFASAIADMVGAIKEEGGVNE